MEGFFILFRTKNITVQSIFQDALLQLRYTIIVERGVLMKGRYKCVYQHDSSDCAAAALSTMLSHYKIDMSLMKLRDILGTDIRGTTVKGIADGLRELNFEVKVVRTDIDSLDHSVTVPAIAQITTDIGTTHFVVLHKITNKDKVIIADPAKGIRKMTKSEFEKIFSGILVLAIPKSEFEQTKRHKNGMIDLFSTLLLPQKKLIIVIVLSSLVLSLVGIALSTSSKILMDEIIPYQLKNSLIVFLIAFGLITLIQSLLTLFRQHIILFLSRKVDIPVLMGYYDHIMHLPYRFFVSRKIGDIITRFQDAMTIKEIFTSASISLVLDLALSLISAIILWNMNSTLFLILFIMVVINIILVYLFKKPYKKINYEKMESSAVLNSHLIESIRNIETLKSQNDENNQINKLESKFVNLLKINYKEGVLQNTQTFISSIAGTLGNLVFMGIGALFIIDGKMSIGDLLVFQTMSQYFTGPIQNIVSLQITYQEAQIAIKRLNELMELKREDEELSDIIDVDLTGDIEFENVTFSYGSRAPVINDFNLVIQPGQKIAIVGESGSGKTTLVKLLMRFMDCTNGKITLSKFDIKDINQYTIRNKIAYIPQNIELFTGSVLENIKIGNEDATYEDVILACRRAGAHEFINRLPNRYNSYVEEGGANFSGGEKQRLAIARALLSDPDIYIFDEATSNLDSFSEQQIHRLMFQKIQGKTTIIIAHRLSTITNCDLICFMEKGKILETGTHEELMKINGQYAKMIRMQTIENRTETEGQEEEMNYE